MTPFLFATQTQRAEITALLLADRRIGRSIADQGWRPSGGERFAEIGPLPVIAGQTYSAQYMEAIFTPGMVAPTHTHAGPEAWYTLAGETCLETPQGKQIGRAGGPPVIVPGGPPMHLTATGTEQRRALVLILHDSSKHATTPETRLGPQGLVQDLALCPCIVLSGRFEATFLTPVAGV